MNALSRELMEEMIGIKMAQMARKEGHYARMPSVESARAEKCRAERKQNSRFIKIAEENKRLTYEAIANGHVTVTQIAKETGLGDESVRKACRRLYHSGIVLRDGIVNVGGGQAFVYKIATP